MNIPYVKGKVAKQAHVGVPEGTFEEEYARNGFFGKYTHFYRTTPLTNWSRIEGETKPYAFTPQFKEHTEEYVQARKPYLHNKDVQLGFFSIQNEMKYFFRNADADEVFFIHDGNGLLETDYGPLQYEAGDYIVIPRGTAYRLFPKGKNFTKILLIESYSEIRIPDRGMIGEHALFDPAVIKTPEPIPSQLSGLKEYEIKIQRLGKLTSVFYPFNPLNVVGWKGTLSVMQINVRDIRPISSDRYHLPPSAHTTFLANNFVICSFLPRPLENGDPLAVKVPFYHSNIDFDEVLFYHAGQFFSREGIGPGMVTYHPQGIHHGPQPKAVERAKDITHTQEVAVMVDTKNPLELTEHAKKVLIKDYEKSWLVK